MNTLTQADPSSALSKQDTARFAEDGFLVLNDIFSPDEVAALREACEAKPEDREWKSAQGTIHSLGLTERHPRFLEMARDPRIIEKLVPLIGENIQIQHSKLAAKPMTKNVGLFGWHQDFAYFPHTNTDLAAVMVMLDDSTAENGCMSMVRGSNKQGLLNHMNEKGFFTGSCQDPVWEREPDRVVPITPRAGGISIHHCLTLHGSPANLSGKPRRGLVIQYRAADAYQLADTVFNDTGLIVRGTASRTVRCTSGSFLLPRLTNRCGDGFGSAWNQIGDFARNENNKKRDA